MIKQNLAAALTYPFIACPSCPLAFASSWVHPAWVTTLRTASSPHPSHISGLLISFFSASFFQATKHEENTVLQVAPNIDFCHLVFNSPNAVSGLMTVGVYKSLFL